MSRLHIPALLAAALIGVATLPFSFVRAEAADAASPTLLDVHTLRPGAKGYGLTVFSGTRPERFDVEVIGVLTNFLPSQDLVLIKTSHPRLEVAKVVAGMSGSPVYIDGKMIGAYAYGWRFGEEPVAGVTPIRSMLQELERPIPPEYLRPLPMQPHNRATRVSAAPPGARFVGSPMRYSLAAHANQVATHARGSRGDSMGPTPVATPLMMGGMRESSTALLRDLLSPLGIEPLQGGGGGATPSPDDLQRYVDGGAIGVQLVSGDMSAAAMGTVTRVSGRRLLAFGHPMMNAGVSRLPATLSKVHWILASSQRSFKIGEPIAPLGSIINDRTAAIVADTGVEAPTFPVHVQIRGVPGAPKSDWNMRVAHEKFMSPMFVAISIGNAVENTTQERRDVTWNAHTTVRVKGHGSLSFHDFGVAVGGTPQAAAFMQSRAVEGIGALLNNPWNPAEIEGVDTRVDVAFARDLLYLRGSEVLAREVAPGKKARIRLHLSPFAGPTQTRIIEVPIPSELAGETVEIKLTPGHEEAPEVAQPENFAELVASLPRQSFPPDTIVASIEVGGHGVALNGQVARRLPPGALDTLRPHASTIAPQPVPSIVRTVIPLGQFVVGADTVQVLVRDDLR